MPLSIKGHYRIQGGEPDGDSLHFHPTNPDAFTSLHLPARLSAQGATQLRLEAIDALETHYSPRVAGGFLQHQPLGLAHAAAGELLRLLGFTEVQRDGERVTSSTPEQTEGYILTRSPTSTGGRCHLPMPAQATTTWTACLSMPSRWARASTPSWWPPGWCIRPTTASCSQICATPLPPLLIKPALMTGGVGRGCHHQRGGHHQPAGVG
jgi:hypothetical protein